MESFFLVLWLLDTIACKICIGVYHNFPHIMEVVCIKIQCLLSYFRDFVLHHKIYYLEDWILQPWKLYISGQTSTVLCNFHSNFHGNYSCISNILLL